MAILQALISLIGKSLGKLLSAIFGWAVVALFGRTSQKEQIVLSGLVGAAAAWPLLVLGIAFPRIATFLVAFIPLSDHIPKAVFRVMWLVLALLVPIAVGVVLARRGTQPPGPQEHWALRVARGFPLTIAIAASFLFMFVVVPVLRVISLARGRRDEHVPCIAGAGAYDDVTAQIEEIVQRHQLGVTRRPPAWWLSAPGAILRKLGGKALQGFMPAELSYWQGASLEIALYPSDVLVRGTSARAAWLHGLLLEELAHGPGLQTFDSRAQDLERQLRQIWKVLDAEPEAHHDSAVLASRLHDVTRELANLQVDYEDWEAVYRQALQLGRALDGKPQLLRALAEDPDQGLARTAEDPRPAHVSPRAVSAPVARGGSLDAVPTTELLQRVLTDSTDLARTELALARSELTHDLAQTLRSLKLLGIGGVCGIITVQLLLASAMLAIAQRIPGWAAGLALGGPLLVVATGMAVVGWKHARAPLARTRRTLKEDVTWLKQRLA